MAILRALCVLCLLAGLSGCQSPRIALDAECRPLEPDSAVVRVSAKWE